jgi:alcohol dehydrogenase class IV
MGPKLIILDPGLCQITPERVWLSTGIRAVDHCVEAMYPLKYSEVVDAEAEKALKNLVPNLLRCKINPQDLEARLQSQLGALAAMTAAALWVPMGASHVIGHQLGPLAVGHGETSCILLPAVMRFNSSVNAEKQKIVARIFWSDNYTVNKLRNQDLEETTAELGDVLNAFIRELGLPRSLKDFGIQEEQLDSLADSSLGDKFFKTNPIPLMEKAQVLEILRTVL